mmetsp:Transcript_95534/g.308124  ORF Transcript_95534/g.308124 Transcript_95534/m.308124 type:complete len:232 (-) Transcript_95534:155-850(-)
MGAPICSLIRCRRQTNVVPGSCRGFGFLLTVVVLAVVRTDAAPAYKWPEAGMGQRTSDRLSAGKRAAKYIACGVCEERVLSLFPGEGDADMIARFLEGESLTESLGDAKGLCGMRDLAKLFKGRRIEVETKPDGSALLSSSSTIPFYEEINTSDLVFHWKSFALQHACTELFRKDGDEVAQGVVKAYHASTGGGMPVEERKRVVEAVKAGCRMARTCKAAAKLAGGGETSC